NVLYKRIIILLLLYRLQEFFPVDSQFFIFRQTIGDLLYRKPLGNGDPYDILFPFGEDVQDVIDLRPGRDFVHSCLQFSGLSLPPHIRSKKPRFSDQSVFLQKITNFRSGSSLWNFHPDRLLTKRRIEGVVHIHIPDDCPRSKEQTGKNQPNQPLHHVSPMHNPYVTPDPEPRRKNTEGDATLRRNSPSPSTSDFHRELSGSALLC